MSDDNATATENQLLYNRENFLLWERASRDTVDFKKVYVDISGDLIAGLLLSQIIYWNLPNRQGKSKLRVCKKGKWYIAKANQDWWDEVRISVKQAVRALRILKEKGIIKTKIFKFDGAPTTHILMNWKTFLSLMDKEVKRFNKIGK